MMKKQPNKQEICKMLDKFFAGETSLDEERQLAQYFRTHEVNAEWREYKQMFALFDKGEVEPIGLQVIESPGRQGKRIGWWKVAAIAAMVVILFGLSLTIYKNYHQQPDFVAQSDTTKAVLPQEPKEELPLNRNENSEERDTLSIIKAIHKLQRPPKHYLAKRVPDTDESQTPQQQEEISLAEFYAQLELLEENYLIQQNGRDNPSFEDIKREIRQSGERLNRRVEIAMNEDNSY